MKSVIIFTFSGTGNTFIVADNISSSFTENGCTVTTEKMEHYFHDQPLPDLTPYDYIGIGYPIHAFNAPLKVVRFVKSLPKCDKCDKKVFIFKTSGEPFWMNKGSSVLLRRKLSKKGMELVFERHFLMPYNVIFRYHDSLVKQMHITSRKLAENMVKSTINGFFEVNRITVPQRIVSFIFRIEWLGKINGLFMRVSKKTCSDCGLCISRCPAKNIVKANGRIKIKPNCSMCMRCVMYCPTGALKAGILRFWAVRGGYDFDSILSNEKIPEVYVDESTRGYFKLFRKYFKWADKVARD